jgi:hypothetical protein
MDAMNQIAHLLTLADIYRAAEPVEDKTLSSRVFGDSKKLTALRDGADITTGRLFAALVWFSEHWPEGAVWPAEVLRPDPALEERAS